LNDRLFCPVGILYIYLIVNGLKIVNTIKQTIKRLPFFRRLIEEEQEKLRAVLSALGRHDLFVPPGHYYSPIPSVAEIKQNEGKIFGNIPTEIQGIDIRKKEQLALLKIFKRFYDELPFSANKKDNLRFYYDNPAYSYSDAIFLYCMIRYAKPKKVIEVGSGYSSCVTLDANELYFDDCIKTTFIEPYPNLFYSLIKEHDKSRIVVIPSKLQDVDLSMFANLQENDILFIDSTHISKINSDVNVIFFEIFPILKSGVFIHFHDVFYPFEYPKQWIYENRAWNELYLLRAFLQYNSAFRIVIFNTFLEHFFAEYFKENMPLCMMNPGGSIWIQKC